MIARPALSKYSRPVSVLDTRQTWLLAGVLLFTMNRMYLFFILCLSRLVPHTSARAVQSRATSPFTNASWPLPNNVTGSAIYVHDPNMIKYENNYYWFATGGLIPMGKAPSLSGPWEPYGNVLETESIINNPGRDDIWAPDVILVNGTFYCYYAVSSFGSQNSAIGVATSTTLAPGSWTDHGQVIATGANMSVSPYNITNAIDPASFVDFDGTAYLNYGSFWGDIWQLVLAENLLSVPTASNAVQVSIDPTGSRPEEGSFENYKDGWYYLWFSHGICCGFNSSDLPAPGMEYSIRAGRSKNVRGPFVDMNGVALDNGGGYIVYGSNNYVYAPGGEGVLTGEHGHPDVLYYHYRE